jgi:uncharacterized protein (DUF433 family)
MAEWIYPVTDGAGTSMSVLDLAEPSSGLLSFANLDEAHILEAARKHSVPTCELRSAMKVVRERERGTPHPLLTRQFQHHGKRHLSDRLAASIGHSWDRKHTCACLEVDLDRHLDRIDRDANDDPYQLFPMRRNQKGYVALNFNLAGGQPVVAGTGLRVWYLRDLIRAGMSISAVANRYRLNENVLAEALAFLGS